MMPHGDSRPFVGSADCCSNFVLLVGNFTANNWGRGPKEHDVPRNDWRQVTSLPSFPLFCRLQLAL